MVFVLEYWTGSQTITGHTRHLFTPVRFDEEAAANWSSQYTTLTSHPYVLIYLYDVNDDTGGSLGKSIIYSNPQPCAASCLIIMLVGYHP